MSRKPRSDAKIKNLPRAAQDALFRMLHPLDADTEPLTLLALRPEIKRLHGFAPSEASLSEWHSWFSMLTQSEEIQARQEQARILFLKEWPDATPEDLERLGQLRYYNEALGPEGNGKLFVQLYKARTERERLAEATRTKIKAGLEALKREITGNPKAMELWRQLESIVGESK